MRSRGFLFLLLAGVVVAAGALALYSRRGRSGPGLGAFPLANGNRLVVWKASFGTNHELVLGRFPQLDSLRRVLRRGSAPQWTREWFGSPTECLMHRAQGDGLCLFYSTQDEFGNPVPNPPWARAAIDGHGCRLRLEQGRSESSAAGTNFAQQETLAYPRRAQEFEVEFGDYQPSTNDVRVRLRNPHPWRGAEWTPEPVPATREIDGLRVTLLGFSDSRQWPGPKFRVEAGGVERPEWRAGRLVFTDATGNRASSPSLCRREPAWRIEAGFQRAPEFDFGADEALVVHEGDLPGAGEAIEVNRAGSMQGVDVRILTLGGPGVFRFESRPDWVLTASSNLPPGQVYGSMSWTSRNGVDETTVTRAHPWVALRLAGVGPDHVWQIVLVDEAGKHHANSGWSGSGTVYICDLEVPGTVRRGRVKCIVQRLRNVSFTVAPPFFP